MKIPLTKPYFTEKDISKISEEVKDVLSSGRLILGKYTERFEKEFAKYIGVKCAIAMNSCTSALMTALRYLDIKDREVIVPSSTFIATPNSVMETGGKVVFAEMNKKTLCMDPNDLQKKITKKTKAVIIVHLLGLIDSDIEKIKRICKERDLVLIEDAAHAHGAEINGIKAGNLSDIGCFSFYPTKVMTTMTGGMLTTNNEDMVQYVKSVRFFGTGSNRTEIVRFGNDWLLGEINAILGFYQLQGLDQNIRKRNRIARIYNQELGGKQGIELFPVPNNVVHSYYKYPVLLPKKLKRDKIIKIMKEKYDIETSPVYIPCHMQPFYRNMFGFKKGYLPVTEQILERVICLPMCAQMTEHDQKYVIDSFKQVLG